jgi:hypothetical protein
MAIVGKKRDIVPDRPSPLMTGINPLSDLRMRTLVRTAAEGNYQAVVDAYTLAQNLVPHGTNLWSWWLDGVEDLAQNGDQDGALYVKFTNEAAGIRPWGEPPAGARERLQALAKRSR